MTQLKDILSEFALKNFPDWNSIQVELFRELKKDHSMNQNDYKNLGKVLRDHMNSNYFSGTWDVDKSKEDLFDELLTISKEVILNRKTP